MFRCLTQLASRPRSRSRSKRAADRRRLLSHSSSYRAVNKSEAAFAPTFTCFEDLPPELRLKVWAYALPDPCVITLHYLSAARAAAAAPPPPRTPPDEPPSALITAVTASRPVPALLHVCSEARELALQFYCRAFSTNPLRPHTPGGLARVWIDFQVDAIHLESEAPYIFLQYSQALRESDRRRIRVLALTKNRRWGLPDYVCQFIAGLSNLQEVVIVRQKPGEMIDDEDLQEMVCRGSRMEEWRDQAYDMAVHERRSLIRFKEEHAGVPRNWRIPRVRLGDCSVS
ncbi:MAG: hypothetical protein M1818_002321 [Claussenomyces sp. TS43310]|nr:MAG: hypothetical protein M1818_002321 [Claussenomyces sp. TS43310]